jgi:periplasmic copper chaperone A
MSLFRRTANPPPAASGGGVRLSEPWALPDSMVAAQAAGCLTIANTGAEADRLVSAHCPLAERTEIHGIKVVGADIRMRPLPDGLPIPPDYTTTLKPRGYHLLLQGLSKPLTSGARLPVTLSFEKAGEVAIELVVREPGLVGEAILNEEYHRA